MQCMTYLVAVMDGKDWNLIQEFPTLEKAKELAIPLSSYKKIVVQIEELSKDHKHLFCVHKYQEKQLRSLIYFSCNTVDSIYDVDGDLITLVHPPATEFMTTVGVHKMEFTTIN